MNIEDRIAFIENFITIANKDRQLVPMMLNNVQGDFMRNKTRRTVVLTARQISHS